MLNYVRYLIITSLLCLSLVGHAKNNAVAGEYLVKIKSKGVTPGQAQKLFNKLSSKAQFKSTGAGLGLTHIVLKSNQNADEVINELKQDSAVEYIEPNYILSKINFTEQQLADIKATETQLNRLSIEAQSLTGYLQSGLGSSMQLEQAWSGSLTLSQSADKPLVAIVDTGADYAHSVFVTTGALWTNSSEIAGNNIDDDGNGYIDDVRGWNFANNNNDISDDDSSGHGTHVAGIVLGATQNILSENLEESRIKILPLKFLDGDGYGTTEGAINAIYYAVNAGAQVINCSWGGSDYSQALHEAMTYAYEHGALLTVAAGNYHSDNDTTPIYPANFDIPGLISIAAMNDYDRLSSFSNYGATKVHLGAPGTFIESTLPGGSFGFLSGTSMAAPFVAGWASMLLREAPSLSGYQLKEILNATSDQVSNLIGKVSTNGRINALASLNEAKLQINTTAYQPEYVPQAEASRSVASSSADDTSSGGCGLVSTALTKGGPGQAPPWYLGLAFVLPIGVWFVLRRQAKKQGTVENRRFERFKMDSEIKVNVGGREIVGAMKTISLGGLSFNADTMLENGGIVKIQIQSPDGQDTIEVEGHIVWSEANKAYGVQFDNAKGSVLYAIANWSKSLVKS